MPPRRRRLNLGQSLEQHLPGPRQRRHRKRVSHRAAANPLRLGHVGAFGDRGHDLDARQPVDELEHVLDDRGRIGAGRVLVREEIERARDLSLENRVQQIEDMGAVGESQHGPDVVRADLGGVVGAVRDSLVQEREPVADRTVRGAGDQVERIGGHLDTLGFGNAREVGRQRFRVDAAQIEPLTARQHRHRDPAHLGGGEHELHVRRRFLERLEERVEGALREHVDLVDDVDLGARGRGPVAGAFDQLADVVDAGVAGGVHFEDIHVAVLVDGAAVLAFAARFDGRPAGAVGANAIERAGDDSRGGRLANPAHAGQHERVRQPPGSERIGEGAHHRLLADQFGKRLRSIGAGEDAVRTAGLAHLGDALVVHGYPGAAMPSGRPRGPNRRVGGWTGDPGLNSLRLLPFGPDRIGEGPVRRQPPA